MLPKYQIYNGFKGVDSIVFNPHKLLLTNFDCCALWTKNRFDLIEALSADASYYTNFATQSGKVIDYKNLQVPLGRRFRSLKLWFVMRNYGAKGLRGLLQNNLDLTQYLVDLISNDGIFEITHPTTFSLVCFRMKPQTESENPDLTNRRNKWIYETISKEGNFLIGHTNFSSKYIFRVSIGNQHNTQESVNEVYEKLKSLAMEVDQHVE
jgi:glutamate/tyrosine decarboxylase-like PLP-dependent enzyme